MHIKKSGGQIFGAVLTKQEEQALMIEVKRMAKDIVNEAIDRRYAEFEDRMDAAVLFTLYANFDFDVDHLRKFWEAFKTTRLKMIERYEVDESEYGDVVLVKLKDIGVDVAAWNKEEM